MLRVDIVRSPVFRSWLSPMQACRYWKNSKSFIRKLPKRWPAGFLYCWRRAFGSSADAVVPLPRTFGNSERFWIMSAMKVTLGPENGDAEKLLPPTRDDGSGVGINYADAYLKPMKIILEDGRKVLA